MLRDILRETEQVTGVIETVVSHAPDVLILQSFDYDAQNAALSAFQDLLTRGGVHLPFVYAPQSNTGLPTGVDIDGDGRKNGPRDAQGYGRFPGEASIAILSRYPIITNAVQTYTDALWSKAAPETDLTPLLPTNAISIQRLPSVAAVAVPIEKGGTRFWILTHHATPPVFDGPEDRNGFRNADENRFWLSLREGGFPSEPYVLAAQMNIDPLRGEGHHHVISEILASPEFADPFAHWPAEDNHTVIYQPPGPGKLRVSYVLPSPDLEITDFGMSRDLPVRKDRSRHRLLWVDIELAR